MKQAEKDKYLKSLKRNSIIIKFCAISWVGIAFYKIYILNMSAILSCLIGIFFVFYAWLIDYLRDKINQIEVEEEK